MLYTRKCQLNMNTLNNCANIAILLIENKIKFNDTSINCM